METGFIELLANVGGSLGLALFTILVLQRTWETQAEEAVERREQDREDRQHLLNVVERNTAVLSSTTEAMRTIADSVDKTRHEQSSMRLLLARRPCIGGDALRMMDDG